MMSNADYARVALQRAAQLMKTGETQQARKLGSEILKAHPRNADGWYLAALLTDEPDKKLKIVERLLEIDSQHIEGNKLLKQLKPSDDMLNEFLHDTELA